MGFAWVQQRFGMDLRAAQQPLQLTIWDYWSVMNGAEMDWITPMFVVMGVIMAMKVVTAVCLGRAARIRMSSP